DSPSGAPVRQSSGTILQIGPARYRASIRLHGAAHGRLRNRMASSASGEAVAQERGPALALARVGDLRPYVLLALLTALVLTLAYAARPVVRIEMGGDYDGAFLRGFNGREIDAAGAAETYPWPVGEETLTVPGRRNGVWIATLRLAPGKPEGILDEAAVAVNDVRVDMPRRTADMVLAKIPP